MDPFDADDLKKLREAIRQAQHELEPFRSQYRERLVQYAGDGFGDNASNTDTPFNVYNLALRILKRRLISGQPRTLVTSRNTAGRMEAYELGLAVDDSLREIDFLSAMKEVVQQGLQCAGIVKVGLVPAESAEDEGFLHDAEQVFCDPILFEDFVYDTAAKKWEEIDFAGNRYRLPLKDVLENPLFDEDVKQNVESGDSKRDDEFREGRDGDESVRNLGTGDHNLREEIREWVTLWDVWLPREGLLLTMLDRGGKPLRVVPWEGPENGPYHLLSFDPIPGNIMPAAPGGHLLSLAKLLNRLMRKLGDQADRQKTIPLLTRAASQSGFADAIVKAEDGEALACDDPKSVNELRLGGVDQNNFAFFMAAREIFSWLGGNIDTIGGLASKADTLGQEKLLAEGGNALVTEMDTAVLQFLKRVITDIAWYLYSDPEVKRQLVKRIEGTDIEIPFEWSPERRSRSWFLFQFEVDPFSVHIRSPSERLQTVMQMYQMIVLPMAQMMAAAGISFDIEGFWRMLVRYTGLNEMGDLIKSNGQPVSAEPKEEFGAMPQKAPFSQREYIRRNVGSGGQQQGMQGPGQQALAMMMSGTAGNGNGRMG